MPTPHAPLTLAIAGLGAIGLAVARRVDAGELPGITLVAAAARDSDKARRATAAFRSPPPLLSLAAWRMPPISSWNACPPPCSPRWRSPPSPGPASSCRCRWGHFSITWL